MEKQNHEGAGKWRVVLAANRMLLISILVFFAAGLLLGKLLPIQSETGVLLGCVWIMLGLVVALCCIGIIDTITEQECVVSRIFFDIMFSATTGIFAFILSFR